MTITREELLARRGNPVYAGDGDKVGSLDEVYFDAGTREPEWIGVSTGFLGTSRRLIPLQEAEIRDEAIRVPYSKDQIKNTPDVGDERDISEDTEAELYRHYGLNMPDRPTVEDIDRPSNIKEGDEDTMTLAEEEVRVGKREVPAGRVRLRKYVESEPVSEDVELRRETAHVEREPIDRPVSESSLGEREIETELHEEEPVVSKEARAKEQLSLEKDAESRRETVTGEVRRERADLDEDEAARRRRED